MTTAIDMEFEMETSRALAVPVRDRAAVEEARALARKAANRRIGFLGHLVIYAATCLFLTAVAGLFPGMIVGLSWGIGIAAHGFFAVVAPELRRRWAEDEEVAIEQAVVSERMIGEGRHNRSLEELAGAVAHEIRNPIAAAKSLVQQISEDPASPDNAEYARVAVEELDRVERAVAHLLRFARDEELAPRPMLLTDAVSSALDTLRERIAEARVVIEREMDTEGALRGDPEQLRRVVINLVHNAVDALAAAPEPRVIKIGVGENLAGSEVWLRVRDNGPGIPADRLGSVFRPFASTKASGTGLGLPVSKKIVEAHGGTIEVRSTPGDGTEFVVVLPKGRA